MGLMGPTLSKNLTFNTTDLLLNALRDMMCASSEKVNVWPTPSEAMVQSESLYLTTP